jgi:hypothetical protein
MSYWHIPTGLFNQDQESSESESESTIETEDTESVQSHTQLILRSQGPDPIQMSVSSSEMSDIYHDEYELESEDSDMVDYMFQYDLEFYKQEKRHGSYYLGNMALRNNNWLMEMSISPNLFYRYAYSMVCEYLREYSYNYNYPFTCEVRVLQLQIIRIKNWPTYCAIDKTYWIRLIQRHWRAVCRENQHKIEQKKSPIAQRYREIHGKYPIGLNRPIGIWGLLAKYARGGDSNGLLGKGQ